MKTTTQKRLIAALTTLVDHAQEAYPHFEDTRGQNDIAEALSALEEARIYRPDVGDRIKILQSYATGDAATDAVLPLGQEATVALTNVHGQIVVVETDDGEQWVVPVFNLEKVTEEEPSLVSRMLAALQACAKVLRAQARAQAPHMGAQNPDLLDPAIDAERLILEAKGS